MRYLMMQLLTWGTIAGAVTSALLLSLLDSPLELKLAALPQVAAPDWSADPAQSGRSIPRELGAAVAPPASGAKNGLR